MVFMANLDTKCFLVILTQNSRAVFICISKSPMPISQQHYTVTLTVTGVTDNSGIEFFYTSIRRQHDAGILTLGHHIDRVMVIPPNAESYSIIGKCSADCTRTVYPATD